MAAKRKSDDHRGDAKVRKKHDADEIIEKCAYETHKKVEEMYRKGQTEMFKDERFIQYALYQVLCEHYKIDKPEKKERVVLEFAAKSLQPFKADGKGGKPRALDLAIDPGTSLLLDQAIPIAIEMKLAANCYDKQKMIAIQSDLIRLSFLRYRSVLPHEQSAEKCYFIMFGLKEELDNLYLPGFNKDHQTNNAKFKHGSEKHGWSFPISEKCDPAMVKSVFLDPNRGGKLKGYDLVDELHIQLVADTTNHDFHASFVMKGDFKTFKTGVKVWAVCMPDVGQGILME